MSLRYTALVAGIGGLILSVGHTAPAPTRGDGRRTEPATTGGWNRAAADAYLDARMSSWMHGGAMEHGTVCISCHTGLPFALARSSGSVDEQVIASVEKRVGAWPEVQPYLGDHGKGLGTEAVINALTLASRDARAGHLSASTRHAFDIFWSKQTTAGPDAGSWPWVNFGNEPWEAPDSVYWGAAMAAVAVGTAPDGYRNEPQIQRGLGLMEGYLRRAAPGQSLLGRLALVWADAKLPGLLKASDRQGILSALLLKQNADGGWSTASLLSPDWKRHDGTPQSLASDGYATGFAALVLGGRPRERALAWLRANQDPATGAWPAVSPNAVRDPKSDVSHFMTDASTAFAVLALSSERE